MCDTFCFIWLNCRFINLYTLYTTCARIDDLIKSSLYARSRDDANNFARAAYKTISVLSIMHNFMSQIINRRAIN